MRNQACTLGKLVNTQTKGITLLCIEKNNVCISCDFNGFKYSLTVSYTFTCIRNVFKV